MKRYSHFFSTIHDESTPVSDIGRGTHYSVLRHARLVGGSPATAIFQDFAVIWDEDRDDRVIDVAERLLIEGLLPGIVAIGERKGMVTLLFDHAPFPGHEEAFRSVVAGATEDDHFEAGLGTLALPSGIISDDGARVRAYLGGIAALWKLGEKPALPRWQQR